MTQTKLIISMSSDIDNKINEFIKKETENNFSFRVDDIKYSIHGYMDDNVSTYYTALVIYEKITKEERQKVIDAYASAYLGKPCEGICDACDDTDCQNTPDEEAETDGD